MPIQATETSEPLHFQSPPAETAASAKALERQFQLYYIRRTLPVTRAGLGLGMFLVLAVCLMDIFLTPSAFWAKAVPFRLGIMLFPMCAVFAATFRFHDRLWLPYVVAAVALIVGVSTMIVAGFASKNGVQMVLWGMIFTTFNIYLILGLNLRQSMLAGWPIFLIYLGIGLFTGRPTNQLAYGCLFLGFSNLVGTYASYLLERNAREIFKTRRELELLARTDGLSGLSNRRRFDEHLQRVWKQARRDDKNIALVLIDIDFFKLYNDCYGHQMGDQCITSVAEVLAASVSRPLDLVARYGGEEFAIILYDSNAEFLESFGRQLCCKVADEQIEHKGSSISHSVTISVGCAIWQALPKTSGPISAEQLLRCADDALYEAKNRGRNRSVFPRVDFREQAA